MSGEQEWGKVEMGRGRGRDYKRATENLGRLWREKNYIHMKRVYKHLDVSILKPDPSAHLQHTIHTSLKYPLCKRDYVFLSSLKINGG